MPLPFPYTLGKRQNVLNVSDHWIQQPNLKWVSHQDVLSAAERRGTPVLLSASVSDNSGNSPNDVSTEEVA